MQRLTVCPSGLAVVFAGLLLAGCRQPAARSGQSFDEIKYLVSGKSAAQVLQLLGEPDSRQVVLDADERWIWWNFTTIEGRDYPPETRGTVVHLEILFKNPQVNHAESPYSEWRIDEVLGVRFRKPNAEN